MKTVDYLAELQKKLKLNDQELAKVLKISKGAMSNYKSGARIMENETALLIAKELNIDPIPLIIAADIERAEKGGQKSMWEYFLMKKAEQNWGIAALLAFVFVTNILTATPAEAAPALNVASSKMQCLYIMSNDVI